MKIPKEIVYHKASKKTNEEVKQILSTAIKNHGENLTYNQTFICGPNLWEYLIVNKINTKVSGINVNFNVPIKNGYKTMKGRAIQKRTDFNIIWNFLFEKKGLYTFTIRKPNTSELIYYWKIIPYDIEEPIFIVEINNIKILTDFSNKNLLHLDLIK